MMSERNKVMPVGDRRRDAEEVGKIIQILSNYICLRGIIYMFFSSSHPSLSHRGE